MAFGTYAGDLGTTLTYRVKKPGAYGGYKIVTEVRVGESAVVESLPAGRRVGDPPCVVRVNVNVFSLGLSVWCVVCPHVALESPVLPVAVRSVHSKLASLTISRVRPCPPCRSQKVDTKSREQLLDLREKQKADRFCM
jgi:hypothetical protein